MEAGAWRDPSAISVHEAYLALGAPPLPASCTAADHPGCPVEHLVNRALDAMMLVAEAALIERHRATTLADTLPDPEDLTRPQSPTT